MIKIKFSSKLYTLKAIQDSVNDFSDLADFQVKEKEDFYELKMENIDPDVKDAIKDEFCNYVLYKMKAN